MSQVIERRPIATYALAIALAALAVTVFVVCL
jgi:hypothetical protein